MERERGREEREGEREGEKSVFCEMAEEGKEEKFDFQNLRFFSPSPLSFFLFLSFLKEETINQSKNNFFSLKFFFLVFFFSQDFFSFSVFLPVFVSLFSLFVSFSLFFLIGGKRGWVWNYIVQRREEILKR